MLNFYSHGLFGDIWRYIESTAVVAVISSMPRTIVDIKIRLNA